MSELNDILAGFAELAKSHDLDDAPAEMRTSVEKADMAHDAHHGGDTLVGMDQDDVSHGDTSASMVGHQRPGGGTYDEHAEITPDGGEGNGVASFGLPSFEEGMDPKPGLPSVSAGQEVSLNEERALGKNISFRHVNAIAESRMRIPEEITYGVGVAPAKVAQEAAPAGRSWGRGMVGYSTSEDERIAKALGDESYIRVEPTINWASPVSQGRKCGLCKSTMPLVLSVCPTCGGSHGKSAHTQLSKAMLREPAKRDFKFPNGVIQLDDE